MIKFVAFLTLFAASTDAWTTPSTTTRQEFLHGVLGTAAAAAVVGVAPSTARAADLRTQSVFTHEYSDPKHPNCKRIVSVRPDGTASVSGTDGNPGCPPDGSGNIWRLVGDVQGDTILVDFSPKGGPANLKGKWDGDGILWPDNNKWKVKD